MDVRGLDVEGALLCAPPVFTDERGAFASPYTESALRRAAGHTLFRPAQLSFSTSRRGVLRGVHYTAAPPGGAKFAYCPHGRALDVVVDLRVGSPTFGAWDSVVLGGGEGRGVYLPTGVGHLFLALEDDTVMAYTLSREYDPANEHAVSPADPELALELPAEEGAVLLSERDRAAPTLRQARERGLLPDYSVCREIDRAQVGAA
ncbi:dTDP-4-dehydrorhamnose 3,5-epimerase [Streptomonospora sp. S1-112]|uniref:dTDP-4-dehydrorhamnose 3,5-epimerase n=1 Tax=Streptomonospora mangrovi TaxID=2883123 RepID=A0A9X3NVP5_9ACTN|nr:dTDP-4-dehydrorhamnose 3,5-epimerase [Streptomonospora mangrovi]MDA0567770.1 dTDP-4-dehydrorhamnose 3,5-epimerase [Streptomonospora mangrovi]